MATTTISLGESGTIIIPEEIRASMHWDAGTVLELIPGPGGVVLQTARKHRGKRLEDLIGLLQHLGPAVPTEVLCQPVDYRADWPEGGKVDDRV